MDRRKPPPPTRAEAERLHRVGDLPAAEVLYAALAGRNGSDPELLYRLALVRFQRGRHADALRPLRRALRRAPDGDSAWMLAGLAEAGRGRHADALAAYDAALALAPSRWDAHVNRAATLLALDRPAEALAAAGRALAIRPGAAEARALCGQALAALGRHAEALDAHEAALALMPGLPEAREGREVALGAMAPDALNRAAVARAEGGRLDEALDLLDRAIARAPGEAVLYYNHGLFGGFGPGHRHLLGLAALERDAAALDAEGAAYLRFALARAAAGLGDHDRAFAELARGNALVRARISHDPAQFERLAERLRAAFPGGPTAAGPAGAGPRPVFVVGVPRSGSTLIERALAAHPRVASVGEADGFRAALDALGTAYPEGAAGLDDAALGRLAAGYRARLPPFRPAVEVVVDKTLVNLWYVGLIHRVLPGARFVHAARDPRDAGLSCFEQLFSAPQSFAYDLAEIGRYCRAAADAMAHWRAALPPGALIAVAYEDLVAEPEREIRRLLDHCGLGFDPACLDPAGAAGPVSTASLAQVRRPISSASVGRWRRYARHLGPLIAALGPG